MRDTARLQVLALALLGACAWLSLDMLDVRSALAGFMPAAPATAPAVLPIHDPVVPHVGNELPTPEIEPGSIPRPLLRPPHRHRIWIVTAPPVALAG